MNIDGKSLLCVTHPDHCPADTTPLRAPGDNRSLDLNIPWPVTLLGDTSGLPCPCEFNFSSTVLKANRTCGGSFDTGAQWMGPDDAPCDFIISAERRLCRLVICPADTTTLIAPSSHTNLNLKIIWPLTILGEISEVECPCDFNFSSIVLKANRSCDDGTDTGAQWMEANVAPCDFILGFISHTRRLCRRATGKSPPSHQSFQ